MVNEIVSFISNPITQAISTQLISTIIATIFLKKNSKIKGLEKLKAEKFDEVIGELLKSGEMSYSELYRTNNFIKIAKKADIYFKKLKKTEKKEETKYDIDWFFRLYDAVGNVSNEQLQELWAKLIANEFVRPVFSYRILELLKNLNYNEALQFEKICNYSIYCSSKSLFIPSDNNFISENGINIDSDKDGVPQMVLNGRIDFPRDNDNGIEFKPLSYDESITFKKNITSSTALGFSLRNKLTNEYKILKKNKFNQDTSFSLTLIQSLVPYWLQGYKDDSFALALKKNSDIKEKLKIIDKKRLFNL